MVSPNSYQGLRTSMDSSAVWSLIKATRDYEQGRPLCGDFLPRAALQHLKILPHVYRYKSILTTYHPKNSKG